jgi:arginase family enzyme
VVFNEALARATKSTQSFGVSLDLDAFDPRYVIATGSLEPNGLSPDYVIPELKGLLNHPKIAGFEIVEYNPSLDSNFATAKVIINILDSIVA